MQNWMGINVIIRIIIDIELDGYYDDYKNYGNYDEYYISTV